MGDGQRGRVVVTGSINADIVIRTERLPGPGETVLGTSVDWYAGGKGANQAAAAARAGAATTFVGCVGSDEHAPRLVDALEDFGVRVMIRTVDGPSGQAMIAVDPEGDNSVIVVPGANDSLTAADVSDAVRALRADDVVVASLEAPPDVILSCLRAAAPARRVLNPSPVGRCTEQLLAEADIVVVNEHEHDLLRIDHPNLVITLGARGVLVGDHHIPAPPVDAVDTTGAGDCFLGTMAARLAAGDDLATAAERAAAAASRSTTKRGAMPSYR